MENVIQKYFILNKDFEILVFIRDESNKDEDRSTLFLPRNTNNDGTDYSFHRKLMQILKEDGINLDSPTFIRSQNSNSTRSSIRYVNNKPVLKKDKLSRRYYLTFGDFNSLTIAKIIELCDSYNILPYFLPIEELERITTKDIIYSYNNPLSVEGNIKDAIKILKIILK